MHRRASGWLPRVGSSDSNLGGPPVRAPAGALVRLFYDPHPEPSKNPRLHVKPGDVLQTPTARRYGVVEARAQTRGKHVGRMHLRCVVLESDAETTGKVWPLHWYKRSRRSA